MIVHLVAEMKRCRIRAHYCNNYFNKHGEIFSCYSSCLVFIFVKIDQKLTNAFYYKCTVWSRFSEVFLGCLYVRLTLYLYRQQHTDPFDCTYSKLAITKKNLANIFIWKSAAKWCSMKYLEYIWSWHSEQSQWPAWQGNVFLSFATRTNLMLRILEW